MMTSLLLWHDDIIVIVADNNDVIMHSCVRAFCYSAKIITRTVLTVHVL